MSASHLQAAFQALGSFLLMSLGFVSTPRSSSAGDVYLLRRVEASEAVDHPGPKYLGMPFHLQAWQEGGGLALSFLHVCPRRVSQRGVIKIFTERFSQQKITHRCFKERLVVLLS